MGRTLTYAFSFCMCFKLLCSGLMELRFETCCHINKTIDKCVGCDCDIYRYCICYTKGNVSYITARKCILAFRLEFLAFEFYTEQVG
jgi:hypothetical protein